MKATGIVRRIDNLGRIVIPKEIRKTLRIKEGDALEIYTDRDGEVILKKYSPIEEMGEYARQYAESLYQIVGRSVFITDTDQIIAAAGLGKKEAINQMLTREFEEKMQLRKQKILQVSDREYINVYSEISMEIEAILVTPIINEGNVIGSVIVIQNKGKDALGDIDMKIAMVGAHYLGNQME